MLQKLQLVSNDHGGAGVVLAAGELKLHGVLEEDAVLDEPVESDVDPLAGMEISVVEI